MNIIQELRDDNELKKIREDWKEACSYNVPPYNYDEYGGIEDYKMRLKDLIKKAPH